MAQTYQVVGMHCGACVRKIQAVLEPLAKQVTVTLAPPQIQVEGAVPFDRLNAAVKGVGSYHLKRPSKAPVDPSQGVSNTLRDKVTTFRPLLLIAGYILLGACAAATDLVAGQFDTMVFMQVFMAGFFLVFSFFKFLNLQGFADAYAGYDILAMRWKPYGLIYPFIELGLGIGFAFQVFPLLLNGITLILMAFGTLGVVKALLDKKRIRCACLGTVLNLPMTTVTVVENLLMVAMSAAMIWMLI